MTKTIRHCPAQLITYSTKLSFDEVSRRLENNIGIAPSGSLVGDLQSAKTEEELRQIVHDIAGDKNFVLFDKRPFTGMLRLFEDTANALPTVTYIIGNPLIAQTLLVENLEAGAIVPFRVLLTDRGNHTEVAYHQPSTLFAPASVSPVLRGRLKELDEMVESLIESVVYNTASP